MEESAEPIRLEVTSRDGIRFVAALAQAKFCAESKLTLTPMDSTWKTRLDEDDIEASLGIWASLHVYSDYGKEHHCNPQSAISRGDCVRNDTMLRWVYDSTTNTIAASFRAEWTNKFYQISVMVRSGSVLAELRPQGVSSFILVHVTLLSL